ncbi:MAG: hypothetical protein HS115_04615 [Spirochaetales bacterium]|nr:hypothetical protein [Spirochaetales bacterium]
MAEREEDPVERSFRKGNINFDFLQPEGHEEYPGAILPAEDRRSQQRDGKRGLFRRGRKPVTIGRAYFVGWSILFLLSLVLMIAIPLAVQSWLFLLFMPILLATFLWSLIMLTLFLARPR